MNAGIKLNIKVGSVTVTRCPYLRIEYARGMVCDTARFHIADTKNEAYGAIKEGDSVSISFGYADSASGQFEGSVCNINAVGNDTIEIIAASIGIKLAETVIKESYNDETSMEIIKRLAAFAGFSIGKIDIPDVQIPHIIFDNIPVYRAVNQVYATLQKLGNDMAGKEYWVQDGSFFIGNFSIDGETPEIKTAVNLIYHGFTNKGFAFIETPLMANLRHSQDFKLDDARRGISGTFRVQSVIHEVDKGKARTNISYLERGLIPSPPLP